MAVEPGQPPEHQPLPVLPHSGKVDQLKEQMADVPAPHPTPLDFGHAMHRTTGELSPAQRATEATIVEVLRTVYDPEIPVNIYELGLVYEIAIDGENRVKVTMTLTSPGCPVAGSLPGEVEQDRIDPRGERCGSDAGLGPAVG